jgi:hypothetical protein
LLHMAEAEPSDRARCFRSSGLTGRAGRGPQIVEDDPELTKHIES